MIYDEKYNIPIFEDEDILDAVDYSEKLKNALVTKFDKDNNTINTINNNIDGISNMVISINRSKADANSVYTKKESDNKYANAIKQELVKVKEAQINSTGANLQDVEIFGESTQETRSGKNKLPNTAISTTINGVEFTVNKDGTVIANGTATANADLTIAENILLPAGDYYLLGNLTGSATTYSITLSEAVSAYNTEREFNVPEEKTYLSCFIRINSGITVNNLLFTPMIRLKSSGSGYEQYGESPSIDYPSPISSITNIDYKATGKNIFDGEMELGSINWATGEFEFNENCIRSKNYIEVIPGQYYAFSNSRNYTHNVYSYDKNKQFISAESVANNTSYKIPVNAKYIRFRTTQGTIENNLDTLFQIEKGSAVTAFEAYKKKTSAIILPEGVELCSLPNGVVDCVDSTGIINKKIGKMVLDGTGNYGSFPGYMGEGYCYWYEDARFKIKNVTSSDYKHSLCTHFTNVYSVWTYDTSKIGTYSDHPTLPRKYFISDKPTVEEFKTQLAELQPTLIFELAEETTQNLAETEKTKLQNLETFEGINNITTNAAISAVYNTDTKSYIDSKFNTLAQQLLNIVGGN